jgi:hypothetical protein
VTTETTETSDLCKIIIGILLVYSVLTTIALNVLFLLYKKKVNNFKKPMNLAELIEKPRADLSNHYALPTEISDHYSLPTDIVQETPLDYALEHENSLI